MSIACPICRKDSKWKFRSDIGNNIFQCSSKSCRHLFVENYLQNSGICEEQDRGHDLSYKKLQADRDERVLKFNERNQALFKDLFLRLNISNDERVLDFGSGDGNLMVCLRKAFPEVEITCVEPHEIFHELLDEVADYLMPQIPLGEKKYDLIVLNEVIEHLNCPVEILSQLNNLLKSGGGIYIATPLGETHKHDLVPYAYETVSHLHFFTRESLNMCLSKSGFSGLIIDDTSSPLYSLKPKRFGLKMTKTRLKSFVINKIFRLDKLNYIPPSQHISGIAIQIDKKN